MYLPAFALVLCLPLFLCLSGPAPRLAATAAPLPAGAGKVSGFQVSAQGSSALNAAVASTAKPGAKGKAKGKASPAKAKAKASPPKAKAKASPPKAKAKKSPPPKAGPKPGPKPSSPSPTGNPPTPAYLRFQRLLESLRKRGGFNTWVTSAVNTGLQDYMGTVGGYDLTIFVQNDTTWSGVRVTRNNFRYQILKFNVFYTSYNKVQLDKLPPGHKFITLDDTMAAYKLKKNTHPSQYNTYDGMKYGMYVVWPSIWFESNPNLGMWTVHLASAIMNPPRLLKG